VCLGDHTHSGYNTFGHSEFGSPTYIDYYYPVVTSANHAAQIWVGFDTDSYWGAGGWPSLVGINHRGYQALFGVSKTSDLVNPVTNQMSTAGLYVVGENDYTGATNVAAYGIYADARGGNGMWAGNEFDAQNTSIYDARIPNPNDIFGSTTGPSIHDIWLYPGGTKTPIGTRDVSSAITIHPTVHTGSGLTLNTTVTGGVITGATIHTAGTNYAATTGVTVSGGDGNAIVSILTTSGGVPQTISINYGGTGYSNGTNVATTIGNAKFKKGINFAAGSIASNGGNYEAINLPANNEID
jgi:hypothetical protein